MQHGLSTKRMQAIIHALYNLISIISQDFMDAYESFYFKFGREVGEQKEG